MKGPCQRTRKTSPVFCLLLCLLTLDLAAQAPQAFNYQTILRDAESKPLANQNVDVTATFHRSTAAGPVVYKEAFSNVKTSEFGLFSKEIGRGNPLTGDLENINWADGPYFLQIEIDAGSTLSSTTELLSVPYALFAENSNEKDGDPTNEIQQISLAGAQLSLSNGGGSVTLPTGQTYSAGAGIAIAGNQISAIDPSPTNEIQQISLAGAQLSLSNGGGSVTLPTGQTYSAGAGIAIAGNQISATDPSATNEIQQLQFDSTTKNLTISGGNTVQLGGFGNSSFWKNTGSELEPVSTSLGVNIPAGKVRGGGGTGWELLSKTGDGGGLQVFGLNGQSVAASMVSQNGTGTATMFGPNNKALTILGPAYNLPKNGGLQLFNQLEVNSLYAYSCFHNAGNIEMKAPDGKHIVDIGHLTGDPLSGVVAVFGHTDDLPKAEFFSFNEQGIGKFRNSKNEARTNIWADEQTNLGFVRSDNFIVQDPASNLWAGAFSHQKGAGDFRLWSKTGVPNFLVHNDTVETGTIFAGNLAISGVKNFRVPYPGQPEKEIWYACIEGPEAAAYERGTFQLTDGEAVVPFSAHFSALIDPHSITVMLTPQDWDTFGLAVTEKTATGFRVRELKGGKGNFRFDWEAKAVRAGYENYQPVREKMPVQSFDRPVSAPPGNTAPAHHHH